MPPKKYNLIYHKLKVFACMVLELESRVSLLLYKYSTTQLQTPPPQIQFEMFR